MSDETTKSVNGSPMSCRTAQSVRRITREYNEIRANKNPYWTTAPINEEEPYEWHFTVRGPVGTEFEGGIYHGKVVLPQNYPLAPPSFTLLNQNGRFEVGRKVCLSASNYHPELWQPAWGIRTMLDALHAFFATPADGAVHSLNWPAELRRKLAQESLSWKCPVCGEDNATLAAKYCEDPTPIRPALPSSMIPPSVARVVPYLRARIESEETLNQEYKGSKSPSYNLESETQPPETSCFQTQQMAPNSSGSPEDVEEQRRQRRARNAERPAHSKITTFEILRIFIIIPIVHFLSYVSDPSVGISEKALVLIDTMSIVLILSTLLLIAGLVLHPGPLGHIFLVDGIV